MEHGIAGKAHALVYGERARSYGHPRKDFRIIGQVWTGLLQDVLKEGAQLDEYRVAVLMTGLKLARLVHAPEHQDSRVDTIGYMLTMERLDEPVKDHSPLCRSKITGETEDRCNCDPEEEVKHVTEGAWGALDSEYKESRGQTYTLPVMPQTYVFPVRPAGPTRLLSYIDVKIQADSYEDAKQAFDAMQIYKGAPDPWEEKVTPDPCEEKVTYPQGLNPSDDEVALAKAILDRRAAFHDREAAELLVRGDGIGFGPER